MTETKKQNIQDQSKVDMQRIVTCPAINSYETRPSQNLIAKICIICSLREELVKITKEAFRDKFEMRFLKKPASKKQQLTQVIKLY